MPDVVLNDIPELTNTSLESLRGIRTNIMFSGDRNRAILFTSATPDEGKSTISFYAATTFASNGKKVLFIDTDIRKSVLAYRYDATNCEEGSELLGLTHMLSGQAGLDDVIYKTNVDNLDMIFAGISVPNVTELLDSEHFKTLMEDVRTRYDYVIVDSAPVTSAIDSSIIAKECDAIILILVPGENSSKVVKRCKEQLEASGTGIIGVILNKVEMKKNTYYGKYYGGYGRK